MLSVQEGTPMKILANRIRVKKVAMGKVRLIDEDNARNIDAEINRLLKEKTWFTKRQRHKTPADAYISMRGKSGFEYYALQRQVCMSIYVACCCSKQQLIELTNEECSQLGYGAERYE